MTAIRPLAILMAAATALLASCATSPAKHANPRPWQDSRQLVLVITPDWNATKATLQRFERSSSAGEWRSVAAAVPVVLGRSGSAWGRGLSPPQSEGPQKKEGDGRNPAGVFAIGPAFGYAETAITGLEYQPMTATSYCMDVPASPLYNRIVDAAKVGQAAVEGSTERMRLDLVRPDDDRYREGLVIEHNPTNIPNAGSCIFAHLWGNPDKTTAGCTAMAGQDMTAMLAWLRNDTKPVFVLLPRPEYDRLQRDWGLPRQ